MNQNLFDLSRKNVLVTGGGGLLGVQHAIALSRANASVYLLDSDHNNLDMSLKVLNDNKIKDIKGIVCDVTDESQVKLVFENLIKQDIFIDVLINNAAIDHKIDSDLIIKKNTAFESFPLEMWKKELAVTVDGAFLMCKYFGSEMSRRSRGSIINIASDLSVISPDNRIYSFESEGGIHDKTKSKAISYSVSKTALIGITRYLAAYWAMDGVRVNAVSPGGIYTNQDERFVKLLSSLIPMGRMANIDEYHGVILFLACSASSYMTGQNIIVDGGRTVI